MRKGHRTVETLKAGVGFCLRDTISDVVSAVGKGQCPVQGASVTEAGALKEEQLEASEQLYTWLLTLTLQQGWKWGWATCPQQRETSVRSCDVKAF